MYSSYVCEFEKNVALLEEQCRKSPAFAKVVQEFEVMTPTQPALPPNTQTSVAILSFASFVLSACVDGWRFLFAIMMIAEQTIF